MLLLDCDVITLLEAVQVEVVREDVTSKLFLFIVCDGFEDDGDDVEFVSGFLTAEK